MFSMRFGGTVQTVEGIETTDNFGYMRRPYQIFMPVCREDLSEVVVGKEFSPLAISIPAARPVWHENREINWSDAMRFEGYCKNAFWLIYELYQWTDIAEQGIPIYISTNESGWPRLSAYARACGYPESQIIVIPDVVPGNRKPSELAHIVKFESLGHQRLSEFVRVLHLDASTRVREDTPSDIWAQIIAEWSRDKVFAHGRDSVWGEGNMMTFLVNNMEEAMTMTDIDDPERVEREFYGLSQWPRIYGQAFGGQPAFYRDADFLRHLSAAERFAYTDEDSLAIALIALGIGDEKTHSLSRLPRETLFHMEPFLVPQNTDALETQVGFCKACALILHRHGEDMKMSLNI